MQRWLVPLVLLVACDGSLTPGLGKPPLGDAGQPADGGERPADGEGDPPDGAPGGDGRDAATEPDAGAQSDAGKEPVPPDEADLRLFDPLASIPVLQIALSPEAEASLRVDARTYVNAELTFTDALGSVGPLTVQVRSKGRYGSARTFDQKMAFKVDLNAVVDDQELFGLRKLNLNNMVQDPSSVHEWMAYQLFDTQDVPAPRRGYARVFVNGVQFGLYLTLEASDDKGFLRRNFPSTRVMYEGEYGEDLFVGAEQSYDEDAGGDPERAALAALTARLANTPAERILEDLSASLHWDEVLAMMATEIFLGHWDGYAPTRNNYFLHFDEESRASLVPWGLDQTFGSELGLYEGNGLILRRCLESGPCRSAYVAALESVSTAARTFLDARAGDVATLAGRLSSELTSDPRFPFDAAQVVPYAEAALAFLERRIATVNEHLACLADPAADTDGDGYKCGSDCAEGDGTRHPNAAELCGDGIDQDCNGRADDGSCPACAPDQALGSTYLFCRVPRSFADASATCASEGGALVKLESATEAAGVSERASIYLPNDTWWLGLNDLATEGTFVWSDGTTLGVASAPAGTFDCGPTQTGNTFCDFGGGEPNDYGGGEDCITVAPGGGRWNDLGCDAAQPFVCHVP